MIIPSPVQAKTSEALRFSFFDSIISKRLPKPFTLTIVPPYMNSILNIFMLLVLTTSGGILPVFDFEKDSDLSGWRIVDDVVMGGRSDGNFMINEQGNGVFYGRVSLENYGGFSSVRYRCAPKSIRNYDTCKIRLKGDGKKYQFRVKTNSYDRHSYIHYFQTSGEWEIIEIPLAGMYPTFRGMELNMPNFPGEQLAEMAFLIGNKKAESFRLEVDWIRMEQE